jgi:hypothetical protein
MPRLAAIVTTTATVEPGLSPALQKKLKVQINLHEELTKQITELEAKCKEIKETVEREFGKAKETEALMAGVKIDGIPVKLHCGEYTHTDMEAIRTRMIELGEEDPFWIENNAKSKKPKASYITIGAGKKKGKKGGSDDD